MPPVVAIVATIVGTYGWVAAAVVVVMAASIAYSAYSMATMPDMPGYSSEVRGRTQVVRSAVVPRRVIYGRCMVSGPLAYALSHGENNKYLTLVVVLAGHEVYEIGDIYLADKLSNYQTYWSREATETHQAYRNGTVTVSNATSWMQTISVEYTMPNGFGQMTVEVPPGQYTVDNGVYTFNIPPQYDEEGNELNNWLEFVITYLYDGVVKITKHTGNVDQPADQNLMDDSAGAWTALHRLRGCAYVVVRLEWDNAAFPLGIPNIKALVKGKKVYDPRTGLTAWSDNWTLCVMDYLTSSYGLNCALTKLDIPGFIAAANICDERVWAEGPDPFNLPTGGAKVLVKPVDGWTGYFEPRYTMNGAFNMDGTPVDIMKKLLTGAAGSLVWSQGLYKIFPAVYVAPDMTFHGVNPDIPGLTESDLRGELSVQPAISRRDKINTVRGTFVDPINDWQQIDFPVIKNDVALAADGQELTTNVELPYTLSSATAQRIAKIHLERGLQTITVNFPAKMSAFCLQPGDCIPLTIQQLGWAQKLFRITNWSLSEEGGVDLLLREESPAIYDWNSGEQTVIDPAPNTNLPDPWSVMAPKDLVVTESLALGTAGAVFTRVTLSWTPATVFAVDYDVLVDGSHRTTTRTTTADIDGLAPGDHVFSIRAWNSFGVVSNTLDLTYRVIGKTAPPADITGLSISYQSGFAYLVWDKSADLDVLISGAIIINHTPRTSGATWYNSNTIGRFAGSATTAVLPAAPGTYLVRAEDSSGNQSVNAVSVLSEPPATLILTEVASCSEAPAFSGVKSGCTVISNQLVLSVLSDFDSLPGNIDDLPGDLDSLTGTQSGTYDFAAPLTLTSAQSIILSASLESEILSLFANFDSMVGDIDSWGPFDGGDPNAAAAFLLVSTSVNDIAWSAWKPFVAGEYYAKSVKFRLQLYSYSPNYTIGVTAAQVSINMVDRLQSGDATALASGPVHVTFPTAFYTATPHLSFSIYDAVAGDYCYPTNVTATGFDVEVRDQSNIPIQRVINWFAKGY